MGKLFLEMLSQWYCLTPLSSGMLLVAQAKVWKTVLDHSVFS
jgi:hypothetical protein